MGLHPLRKVQNPLLSFTLNVYQRLYATLLMLSSLMSSQSGSTATHPKSLWDTGACPDPKYGWSQEQSFLDNLYYINDDTHVYSPQFHSADNLKAHLHPSRKPRRYVALGCRRHLPVNLLTLRSSLISSLNTIFLCSNMLHKEEILKPYKKYSGWGRYLRLLLTLSHGTYLKKKTEETSAGERDNIAVDEEPASSAPILDIDWAVLNSLISKCTV